MHLVQVSIFRCAQYLYMPAKCVRWMLSVSWSGHNACDRLVRTCCDSRLQRGHRRRRVAYGMASVCAPWRYRLFATHSGFFWVFFSFLVFVPLLCGPQLLSQPQILSVDACAHRRNVGGGGMEAQLPRFVVFFWQHTLPSALRLCGPAMAEF